MKKAFYCLISIIVVFIITNPSDTAFKAYLGRDSYMGLKKELNLFILSKYWDNSFNEYGHRQHTEYIGILGNFLPVKKTQFEIDTLNKNATINIDSLPDMPKKH